MAFNLNNKKGLEILIKQGVPCFQRFGFSWKGASTKPITKEKALQLLPNYSPGMGFYELREEEVNGEPCLTFVEYSESDMF